MAGFSDYWENTELDRTTGKSPILARYIALYTVAPTDAGGGTEVTGGAYARAATAAADWNAAAAGSAANANAITYAQATADWGTVVAFAVFDAVTAGNMLAWNTVTQSKAVFNGDTASFPAGSLVLTLD